MMTPSTRVQELIESVFGDMYTGDRSAQFLVSRAALTPKNTDVTMLNNMALNYFLRDMREYGSADSMSAGEDHIVYPTELLNPINQPSLPPRLLCLKVGYPIMLLRNIDPANGLCNGTHLICLSFQRFVIEAEIASGVDVGKRVFIPCIAILNDANLHSIEFKRTQLPVRFAFGMTINKSQGQTFDTIGLFLPMPVFPYGQLYVAMSQVRRPSAIKIMIDSRTDDVAANRTEVRTSNIVYTEVFERSEGWNNEIIRLSFDRMV